MQPTDQSIHALIAQLSAALPAAALMAGDAIDPRYQEDRRDRFSARPQFVIRPSTTAEMSLALSLCNDFRQPLVVQGGRTGLSGAHRIHDGEAVLSLERLTQLTPPDQNRRTILAGAGVPLQRVQESADAADLMFGVDIGARGTATIGGNIATNAGGIRVMRYGMFRAQIAGLEVVLADGSVLTSLRGLDKDNSGYDLNQLFIGSEGTLGVVTQALLRLHPKPAFETNALIAMPCVEAALQMLWRLRAKVGRDLSAYEIMLADVYQGAARQIAMAPPLTTPAPVYVLAEIQAERNGETAADTFMECLSDSIEDGLSLDAVIAQSRREYLALWALRDGCADYVRGLDNIANGDISIPITSIDQFLHESQAQLRQIDPETTFLIFGHLGDGNLHYVFQTACKDRAVACLMRLVSDFGGSVSAEHGIGMDKKQWLPLSRSSAEIKTMKALKTCLDPNHILNNGRIFS